MDGRDEEGRTEAREGGCGGGDGLEQQLRLGLALVVEEGRELVRQLFELSEGEAAVT